ncbi:MAG: peptidylprolyl isomerase, partial [Bacteroidia bacterium]|nr:peptidylprolyl isomerase [Bacteroidia bacterium]
ANFVALAEGNHPQMSDEFKGKNFFKGLIFHRVMDDFMIQGGCPNGNGRGNAGYRFGEEFDESLKHDKPGILSMANGGPNSTGSQFFITEKATPWLDGIHSVFGELVMGIDIQDSISNVEVGNGNKPVEDVIIEDLVIIRQGFDARKFDAPKTWETELPTLADKRKAYEDAQKAKAEAERQMAAEKAQEAATEVDALLKEYEGKGTKTSSGITYYQIEAGEGEKPQQGDRIKVNYDGYFPGGMLFGSSSKELEKVFGIYSQNKEQRGFYGELTMTLSPEARMIQGFKEAVGMMNIGDKYYFNIPSHLAWGEQGSPPTIPPNADVIYIIQMLSKVE